MYWDPAGLLSHGTREHGEVTVLRIGLGRFSTKTENKREIEEARKGKRERERDRETERQREREVSPLSCEEWISGD